MNIQNDILNTMIQNELGENRAFEITHHQAENPERIDVARDETLFVHKTEITASVDFWLEYHSGTQSRLISKSISALQTITDELISRHKGSVYFHSSHSFDYKISYIKLKIIK